MERTIEPMDADPKYPTAANAFPAFHAATGSASSVLRELEWSKAYSYCTGWPCCCWSHVPADNAS